jgi:HAD superfamily hydrolase (TIGR01509 family)
MLYVFDCDGVLIDSEIIAAEVDADAFTKAGFEITPQDIMRRFAGATFVDMHKAIEDEMGRSLPDDFVAKQRAEVDKRLADELDAVPGVHDMLDKLEGQKCICSNSTSARLLMTLEKTQLYTRFAPHIFSAVEVGSSEPKPSPNVYDFAIKQFGVDPSEAVVLEDSAVGVKAARAAGTRVIGFTGGAHTWPGHADDLTEAGAETVIHRFEDYLDTAKALHAWRQDVT